MERSTIYISFCFGSVCSCLLHVSEGYRRFPSFVSVSFCFVGMVWLDRFYLYFNSFKHCRIYRAPILNTDTSYDVRHAVLKGCLVSCTSFHFSFLFFIFLFPIFCPSRPVWVFRYLGGVTWVGYDMIGDPERDTNISKAEEQQG